MGFVITFVVVAIICTIITIATRPKANRESSRVERQNYRDGSINNYPGVLWLLPIFFSLPGGIVASVIASMKYQARWGRLFVTGLIFTVLESIGYWYLFIKPMDDILKTLY